MSEKKLILSVTKKDIDITFFNGTGAGGQHRNKKKCCVRMKHRDSGAQAVGQDQRDKRANTEACFLRLIDTKEFKAWEKLEVSKRLHNTEVIDRNVTEQMKDKNIKCEVKNSDGEWIEIDPELIGVEDE